MATPVDPIQPSGCPNGTYCTDGKITRVGFMAEQDMDAFRHKAGCERSSAT